jgi:hypothetical protein
MLNPANKKVASKAKESTYHHSLMIMVYVHKTLFDFDTTALAEPILFFIHSYKISAVVILFVITRLAKTITIIHRAI